LTPPDSRNPQGREVSAAERADREVRRYFRRWIPWAAIYALGFVVLWAVGLAGTQAFYVWAIGWVLLWGAWVHTDYVRRYLPPRRRRNGDDDDGGA
jgi:uncharacterized membrane protein YecN with MAPEG domain